MAIPESFIDELVERNDIVDIVSQYVRLTKKGGSYVGLCPFHNEKTPSFSVSQEKQLYHCFGCGKGGGILSFVMGIETLSLPDAVHFLAERSGMTVPEEGQADELPAQRKRMLALNKEAARWFYQQLQSEEGKLAAQYLEKRKIAKATATRFGLGFAPDGWDKLLRAMQDLGYTQDELLRAGLVTASQNSRGGKGRSIYDKFRGRLMFPVIDVRGEVIGFSGRALMEGQEPKYLNSPETLVFAKRRSLFGMNLAKNTKRGSILLVEGNIDVVTLHQAGFDNAVASMGTALTAEQTKLISRYSKALILCYDNDAAGKKATERALDILKNSELSTRVLKLPDRIVDGKAVKIDADDFIQLRGSEAFERLLSGSGGGMEYRLDALAAEYDLTNDAERVEYLRKLCTLLAAVDSPAEREVWCGRAAGTAGISTDSLKAETERIRKNQIKAGRKQYERNSERPSKAAQPRERRLQYSNIKSALAEEGVIRILMLDPELIRNCTLRASDFSSEYLGRLYETIQTRWTEGKSLLPAAIVNSLEESEAEQFTEILRKPESGGNAETALNDYISTIQKEKTLRNGDFAAISRLLSGEKSRKTE